MYGKCSKIANNFAHFFCLPLIFFKINFFQKRISEIPSVSNSLDPDQARQTVGPVLGPNCSQRLSTDDLFDLILCIPVNNFSVMSRQVFLG